MQLPGDSKDEQGPQLSQAREKDSVALVYGCWLDVAENSLSDMHEGEHLRQRCPQAGGRPLSWPGDRA